MDNDREFKNWFDAIWLGDEDSGQFIPNQKDEDYAEYLEQYTLAHGAYKYALAHSKERIAELEAKYQSLIMQVGTKHPNESRHETALRYIKQAENKANSISNEAMKGSNNE